MMSTGLLGAPVTSTASAGILFATPTPNTGAGFTLGTTSAGNSFGLGATTQTPAAAGGGLFGSFNTTTPASQPGGLFSSFGAATTKPAPLSFGGFGTTTTAPATATGTLFGTGGLGTSTVSTGFGTTGGSFGFTGLGTGATTTSGLFGGLSSTAAVPAATTAQFVGLGGVDVVQTTAAGVKDGATTGKTDSKAAKESQLPNELLSLTESFKKYVTEQQTVKEEIRRVSSKELFKVQEETSTLKQQLMVVAGSLQKNGARIEKLKLETLQELRNAELAHHIADTPAGLQYDYAAPLQYFQLMACQFENKMALYRQQIEQMERHLTNAGVQSGCLNPQEVTLTIKRLHDTFVALAARLQGFHEMILILREQFLQYRRFNFGDTIDPFDTSSGGAIRLGLTSIKVPVTVGPNPFTGTTNATAAAMASAYKLNCVQAGVPPTMGLGTSQGLLGSSTLGSSSFGGLTMSGTTGFGSSSFLGKSLAQDTSSFAATPATSPNKTFQLQKPPISSKRGKR